MNKKRWYHVFTPWKKKSRILQEAKEKLTTSVQFIESRYPVTYRIDAVRVIGESIIASVAWKMNWPDDAPWNRCRYEYLTAYYESGKPWFRYWDVIPYDTEGEQT